MSDLANISQFPSDRTEAINEYLSLQAQIKLLTKRAKILKGFLQSVIPADKELPNGSHEGVVDGVRHLVFMQSFIAWKGAFQSLVTNMKQMLVDLGHSNRVVVLEQLADHLVNENTKTSERHKVNIVGEEDDE